MKKYFWLYIIIIAAAVVSRIIPHAWNFAPITAIAIFAAIYLPIRQAVVLPLVIRFISDVIIGFFSWQLMIAVYLSHLFGVALGLWVRRSVPLPTPGEGQGEVEPKHESTFWSKVLFAPMISSIVFFLVTNFAWLYASYTNDLAGILLAYTNGLPFLRGTLMGDVFYTLALVGGYEFALRYSRQSGKVKIDINY